MDSPANPSKPIPNQSNTEPIARSTLSILGHLAVWPMLYAVGIMIILGKFTGLSITWKGLVFVILCSHAGYLFDRIKFRDMDMDPADHMAQPNRHAYLQKHARPLRSLMFIQWAGAAVIGTATSPILGLLVFVGIAAGFLYAGWKPKRQCARLKDLPGLKAGLVASAVVGIGLITLLMTNQHTSEYGINTMVSGISKIDIAGLWILVCGDAVICDMDDRTSDQAFSTKSLPVMLGTPWAGVLAAALLLSGGTLLLIGQHSIDYTNTRFVFVTTTVISGIGITFLQKRQDWIDGRLLIVVLSSILL